MSRLLILCLLWIAEIKYARNMYMYVCSDTPRDPDILPRVSDYSRSPVLLLGPDYTPGKPYKPGSTYTPVSTNPGVHIPRPRGPVDPRGPDLPLRHGRGAGGRRVDQPCTVGVCIPRGILQTWNWVTFCDPAT